MLWLHKYILYIYACLPFLSFCISSTLMSSSVFGYISALPTSIHLKLTLFSQFCSSAVLLNKGKVGIDRSALLSWLLWSSVYTLISTNICEYLPEELCVYPPTNKHLWVSACVALCMPPYQKTSVRICLSSCGALCISSYRRTTVGICISACFFILVLYFGVLYIGQCTSS